MLNSDCISILFSLFDLNTPFNFFRRHVAPSKKLADWASIPAKTAQHCNLFRVAKWTIVTPVLFSLASETFDYVLLGSRLTCFLTLPSSNMKENCMILVRVKAAILYSCISTCNFFLFLHNMFVLFNVKSFSIKHNPKPLLSLFSKSHTSIAIGPMLRLITDCKTSLSSDFSN